MERQRQTIILFLLSTALAFGSFFFFSVFLTQSTPPFAFEIAAAIMGSIITVIITMILLNKQSEAEMMKERTVKILEQKLKVYDGLIDQVKKVLIKGKVSDEDIVEIQILNQKLSFIACREVLKSFNDFANNFIAAAADTVISSREKDELLELLGDLSIEIRKDLASPEEKQALLRMKDEIRQLVHNNIKSLSSKTTEDDFLNQCNEEEKTYYKYLFKYMQDNAVVYRMGVKGFSIQNDSKASILNCFPTSAKRNIEIMAKDMSEEKQIITLEFLQRNGKSIVTPMDGKSRISFKTGQLEVPHLCDLIGQMRSI